jgi:hypothetical protein
MLGVQGRNPAAEEAGRTARRWWILKKSEVRSQNAEVKI